MQIAESMRSRKPRYTRPFLEALETRLLLAADVWTSGSSGNWDDASKWSLHRAPNSGDAVTINAAGTYTVTVNDSAAAAATVTLGGGSSHPSLAFNGTNSSGYALNVGGTFTNNGAVVFNSNTNNSNASRLAVGTFVNTTAGSVVTTAGSNGGVQPNLLQGAFIQQGGKVSITSGANLEIAGAVTLGNLSLAGSGTLDLYNNAISIPAAGSTFASGTASLYLGQATVSGPGTLTNAAGSTLSFNGTTINAALVNHGTLTGVNGNTFNGPITEPAGSLINLPSNASTGVNFIFNTGFTNNGTITFIANTTNSSASQIDMGNNATLTNAGSGLIQVTAGANSGVQPNLLQGSFANLGGKISISANANLEIGGNVTLGNTALAGTGTLDLYNDTISIPPGGASIAQGAASIYFPNATVNGPGVWTNVAGNTLSFNFTTINAALINDGTLTGINGDTFNGPITEPAGSVISLPSNASTGVQFIFNSSFTNDGTITLDANTTNSSASEISMGNNATLTNAASGLIQALHGENNTGQPNLIQGNFNNAGGKFYLAAGTDLQISGSISMGNATITGSGTLDLYNDTITIPSGGAAVTGASDVVYLGGATVNGAGTWSTGPGIDVVLNGTTVNAKWSNLGTVTVNNGSSVNGTFAAAVGSTLDVVANSTSSGEVTFATGFTNNGTIAFTNSSAGKNSGTLVVNSGTLTNAAAGLISVFGSGLQQAVIQAPLVNSGTLSMSFSAGLDINGTFTQTGTGTYAIVLPYVTHVSGNTSLAGLLDIYHVASFKAAVGVKYAVMTYPMHTGNFSTHDGWSLGGGVQVNNAPAATEYDLQGAVAIADSTPPTVSAFNASTPTLGASTVTFTITFADNVAIDVSTLGSANVTVTGPEGFGQAATLVSISKSNNGTPRTAVYSITPTIGRVDVEANGTYTVKVNGNSVKDTRGNAVAAKTVGTFTIAVAATLVVTASPTTGKTNAALTPALIIEIEDSKGKVITTDDSTVTISISTGPSGGKLTGTTSVAAKNGVATFSHLLVSLAGKYVLKASDGSDLTGLSATVVVTG